MGFLDLFRPADYEPKTYTPFVPRSKYSDCYIPTNRKEAEFMAPQWLKHAQDSTKIVNTTKKPEIFFERYKFLLDSCDKLSRIEDLVKFSGLQPSQQLIRLQNAKEHETKIFIDRCYEAAKKKIENLKTEKAKENNIQKLEDSFQPFLDEMSNKNLEYLFNCYDKLKQLYK